MLTSYKSPEAWGVRVLDELRQDFGYAWRGLARNPGFAAAVLLTLVIGIGACTAVFSAVYAVLLRPLPYREPGRLVAVSAEMRQHGSSLAASGYANVEDWRRMSRSFESLAAHDPATTIVTEPGGEARRFSAILSSPNIFEVYGVAPALGRTFTEGETARRDPVAVLSHALWQQLFAGTPDVLGRTMTVDGRTVAVIGVMPAEVQREPVYWLPLTAARNWDAMRQNRGTGPWRVVARLAEGATVESAQSELSAIARNLETAFPAANAGLGVRVTPIADQSTSRPLRLAFWVLAAAVAAVQLIACNNVANLLLARGAARQREFAVRTALGAGRSRLIRQMVVESMLVAFLAAAAGSAVAYVALKVLIASAAVNIPRLGEARLDVNVLIFTVLLGFLSALLSGLLPAVLSTRRPPIDVLRGSGRGISTGRTGKRVRAAIVVSEFALAILLLTAAALLLRSFARLTAVDTGYRAENALVVGLNFPASRPIEQAVPYTRQLLERIGALPGVVSAGISEEVLLGEVGQQRVTLEGQTLELRLPVSVDAISPDYFRTVGVPLRMGRFFTDHDGPDSLPVVIVNETLAQRLSPGENLLGRRIRIGGAPNAPWETIVGVVADLRRHGPERVAVAQAFRALAQSPSRPMNLVVATTGESAALAPIVRAAAVEVDRTVPVSTAVTTLGAQLDRKVAPQELTLGLVGAFAVIGLVLAGIGVFGLMNFSVVQRTQEIGVRMALGASPAQMVRLILRDGLRLALAGTAIGVVAACFLAPILRGLLFELSPLDPVAYLAAAALLLGTAALACYLPSRRVTTIDPVIALRTE